MNGKKISWANLGDGKWGVRVDGDLGSNHARMMGKEVEVRKRDGGISRVRLGKRLHSYNARTSIYEVAR